jgi:hypothetical protein
MSFLTSLLGGATTPWAYLFVGLLALVEAAAFVGLVVATRRPRPATARRRS